MATIINLESAMIKDVLAVEGKKNIKVKLDLYEKSKHVYRKYLTYPLNTPKETIDSDIEMETKKFLENRETIVNGGLIALEKKQAKATIKAINNDEK